MSNLIQIYTSALSRIPVMGLILLATTSVIIGDYSAKAWATSHNNLYLGLVFLGYFFSAFFYLPTLLREGLIITSVLWGLFSTIGFLFIGFIIFKETLSPLQLTAVFLGVVSILMLTIV